tara:strand:- start:524 stop:829 length:306 start_codon:yes stop_codon:yes gene_type:complete
MKITKTRLKQIIKEEVQNILDEGNSKSYAMENMLAFCEMGWSISDSRKLWSVSGGGRMSADEVSRQCQRYAQKHGDKAAARAYGLQRFIGKREDCKRLVQR